MSLVETAFTKYELRGAYHWDELAGRRPRSYSARLHALYDWFVGEARRARPSLIVDVGCGDAALTHLLSDATRARVVGIEPEPRGVELAGQALRGVGSGAEVVAGRGEDLPFEDASASLVVMCEVVEHVEPLEPLLAEAARVLSPEGTLLVSTPQQQGTELRPYHVHELTASELEEALTGHFETVELTVSEPPRLYRAYMGSRWARIAVNSASLVGLNPFRRRRPANQARREWRELLAVARRPH